MPCPAFRFAADERLVAMINLGFHRSIGLRDRPADLSKNSRGSACTITCLLRISIFRLCLCVDNLELQTQGYCGSPKSTELDCRGMRRSSRLSTAGRSGIDLMPTFPTPPRECHWQRQVDVEIPRPQPLHVACCSHVVYSRQCNGPARTWWCQAPIFLSTFPFEKFYAMGPLRQPNHRVSKSF